MMHNLSFAQLWVPVLKPLTIGAILLGLVFGLLFYALTRWGMAAFREQRRRRLAEKTRLRQTDTHDVGSAAR
jgi:uncharacterized protein (DUF2062 family)